MPPRAKKTAGGSGARRAPKATKASAAKAAPHNEPETVAGAVANEEGGKADTLLEEVSPEEKPPVDDNANATDLSVEPSNTQHGSHSRKQDNVIKEPVDEYERGERLDLGDHEGEFEPEEDVGVEYDEKEVEQEDVKEEGDEDVEEVEEDVTEIEEGDTGEEDVESVHEEELEAEEDDEHVHERGLAGFVDAGEEDEHHDVVKERRKRKEFEVFVGGLDKDATEEDLKKVFSVVGEITEVRLMKSPQTRKNKGFAFLRYATVDQARRAVTELKNPVVNGKQCGVTPSQDSDTLFLGNICKTWTKEALEKKLKHYGVENIEDITLVEDSNSPGMNRGFAFLEFSSRIDARDAFKRLQKRDVVFGVDRAAKCSFADSFIDPGDEIMSQVKTVFVDGIPASWDEDHVKEFVKKYGRTEKIELARSMPHARRKDYGFVSFDTHDAAVTCAKSINNAELGEGDNKVKVRARLSRPLQKGRGKHVSHARRVTRHAPRAPWNRPLPRALPARSARTAGHRLLPASGYGIKRSSGLRDRHAALAAPSRGMASRAVAVPPRARPLPPPPPRSYGRRAPVPSYPKSSVRDYSRREEIYPRSRVAANYDSRVVERRPSYHDDYSTRGGYPETSRSSSARSAPRRNYLEDAYGPRYDRPPPSYREGHARDYASSGSKRPYSSLDDVPPRYVDSGVHHSRARLDYDIAEGASQYGDAYGDRLGRSSLEYGASRSTMSSEDTHGVCGSRRGMAYGSYGSSNAGGVYSSGFAGDYVSRESDVGGSSYSSMYASRGTGHSGYVGSIGSRSFY